RMLLTCIACLSCYSIHLLLRSAGVVGIRAYEQLGLRAFGHPGKILAAVIITLHNIGGNTRYLGVIYKRFNITCPLEVFGNYSVSTEDICAAKLFTINQEPNQDKNAKYWQCSILGMFIMYFFTAVFGYLTFYENTEAELLHTYSKVDPLDTLILCVRLAVLVAVTLTVPVVLFPIRRALLQLLFPGKPFQWLRHITIAVCLLFAVNLLVILVPNIRDIFGITGATTAPSLIFILPGLFYIRIIPINQEPMNSRPKIQAACFTALGFIFMTMSLTFIGLDWMSGERRNLGH
ncbi:Sodium-coupled neutral amino acid transporter 3, partial [Nibea albiflora]